MGSELTQTERIERLRREMNGGMRPNWDDIRALLSRNEELEGAAVTFAREMCDLAEALDQTGVVPLGASYWISQDILYDDPVCKAILETDPICSAALNAAKEGE